MELDTTTPGPRPPDRLALILRWVLGLIVAAVVLVAGWLAYAYAATPSELRNPTHAHYHFRLQIISGGKAVNFADAKFQTDFNKDICSATLTKEPVHFHDNLDQFVHIHWNHLTGGVVLKDYGWNFIGGTRNTLGYRFDTFPKIVRVPVHGLDLPATPVGAHYYVYTSTIANPTAYTERAWKDFLHLDLEDFFHSAHTTSWLDIVAPRAEADSDTQLAALNDVLGNVVIFAQKNPPTAAQIKDRFAHLVPLPLSTCGG